MFYNAHGLEDAAGERPTERQEGKGKGHSCTATEALYRPNGSQGE